MKTFVGIYLFLPTRSCRSAFVLLLGGVSFGGSVLFPPRIVYSMTLVNAAKPNIMHESLGRLKLGNRSSVNFTFDGLLYYLSRVCMWELVNKV
jgi:hypothetical protein